MAKHLGILLSIVLLLAACGSSRAVRVNCHRHLEPINLPVPVKAGLKD
jgi:hypothetical protein